MVDSAVDTDGEVEVVDGIDSVCTMESMRKAMASTSPWKYSRPMSCLGVNDC